MKRQAPDEHVLKIAKVFLRISLATAFLSAIADRFGLVGGYGAKNVAWGDWSHFVQFVAVLNWFLPKALIPVVAVSETIIELTLSLALLFGIYQRIVAWSSAALLMLFALTMSVALGVKVALDYSVFTAAAGALILGSITAAPAARRSAKAAEPM
jgi:hypothetical protein